MGVDIRVFQMMDLINNRLANIEKNITRIDEKLDYSIMLSRNHLIRVKNGDMVDDNMILMGLPYNDLSPQKAYSIFENPDVDFIVLDVTNKNFKTRERVRGSVHIPLEELNTRFVEISSKTTPILIISEVGLRSIQACEMLVKKGFFNINNVSGGYKLWPGFQKEIQQQA